MGCVGSTPAGQPAFESPVEYAENPTFVVDVGGGSLCIYLNDLKVYATTYIHDEYTQLTAKTGWDVMPLMQQINGVITKLSSQDLLKGKGFVLKVGITGDGRNKLTKQELIERIQSIYDGMKNIPGANLSFGILSHDFESELEQKSAWDILDVAFPKHSCVVFNMGGHDSRIFSKEFAMEFAGKGGEYALKDGYQTGDFDPKTFSKRFQTLEMPPKKTLIAFCGFYGYFFSMVQFKALWKSILYGKPIPVKKMKKALRVLYGQLVIAEQEDDPMSSDVADLMVHVACANEEEKEGAVKLELRHAGLVMFSHERGLVMNNRDRKGTTRKQMLMQRKNQCEMALSFIDNMEKKMGAHKIGGCIVDNKLGIHAKKLDTEDKQGLAQDKMYIDAFNKHFSTEYAELKEDGTFGTPYAFSWAIPLGMSTEFEVPDTPDGNGTTALWVRKGEDISPASDAL
jgi:hypothetical protein